MAIFQFFSDVMTRSLTRGWGELIEIISLIDDSKHTTYGIYEDSYYSIQGGEVPVLVDAPSFIIRNADITFTEQYPLYRKDWKIRRIKTDTTYLITNYERDEVSTVRYLLTTEKED